MGELRMFQALDQHLQTVIKQFGFKDGPAPRKGGTAVRAQARGGQTVVLPAQGRHGVEWKVIKGSGTIDSAEAVTADPMSGTQAAQVGFVLLLLSESNKHTAHY